jgi:hypothetical protein
MGVVTQVWYGARRERATHDRGRMFILLSGSDRRMPGSSVFILVPDRFHYLTHNISAMTTGIHAEA